MTVFLLMWESQDPDVGLSIQGIYTSEEVAQDHIDKDYTHWQSGGAFYIEEWEVSDKPSDFG